MNYLLEDTLHLTRVTVNKEEHWYRWQGIRYDIQIDKHPKITVTFHEIYSQVLRLAHANRNDNKEPLSAIHSFIDVLQTIEKEGQADYEQKKPFYKWLTEICRLVSKFFGKTPKEGTHQERLNALRTEIGTILTNLKNYHDPVFYAALKTRVENRKQADILIINQNELPKCPHSLQFRATDKLEKEGLIHKCAMWSPREIVLCFSKESLEEWRRKNP